MKKKTKQNIVFTLISKFGWLLILLLGKLSFIKTTGRHYWKQLKQENARFIYIIWHGRILLPIYLHRYEGITAMVSLHADGEMIAQTLHRLGYKTVRGSSTRGGKEAFYEMVEILKNGGTGAIMPDGPRGPRHKFKSGAIYLAQLSDAFLLPFTFASKRKIQFNSWDRFNLITPFSRAIAIYGKPIKVPTNLSKKEMVKFRQKIEQIMIHYEHQADEYFKTRKLQ